MADLESLIRRSTAKQINDKINKKVFNAIHVETDKRIFKQGIDASERLIGVYSPGYMKQRRRKNYPISRKVILQATSQMANDYKFLVLPGNTYGSGFSNIINYQKSKWVEQTYEKNIFRLTNSEEKMKEKLLDKELEKWLNI